MQKYNVGLDSQCLSYLLDAIKDVEEPTNPQSDEKKALLRTWFYQPGTFIVPETVVLECANIRNMDRREFHDGFIRTLFLNYPVRDTVSVEARANHLMSLHSKVNDCRILAEAEDLGLHALLTYDRDFLRRLGRASEIVSVMAPSGYWSGLRILRGARP